MTYENQEFFGTPEQQGVQRRAHALWALLRDDPRYCTHGRAIALADDGANGVDRQVALARLQGAAPRNAVCADQIASHRAALQARGFKLDQYEVWRGGQDALATARDVLEAHVLPRDLTVGSVDAETDAKMLLAIADVTQSCGVLLPMGSFMRGISRPGVCICAFDENGQPVATSAAVAQFHTGNSRARESWWGMLATHKDRRGQGIALILGAMSMIAMYERHGFTNFSTGIRDGNIPSEKLCSKLGLYRSDDADIIAIDPDAFTGGQMTK